MIQRPNNFKANCCLKVYNALLKVTSPTHNTHKKYTSLDAVINSHSQLVKPPPQVNKCEYHVLNKFK